MSFALTGCGSEGAEGSEGSSASASASEPGPSADPAERGAEGGSVPGSASDDGADPSARGAADDPIEGHDADALCSSLRSCCTAYPDAIADAVEAERARIACEQLDSIELLGDARGAACRGALEGFRRALEERGREAPSACR